MAKTRGVPAFESGKTVLVGKFFEMVFAQTLRATPPDTECVDLSRWCDSVGFGFEIKASGEKSSYGFRLSIEQLERNRGLAVFPYDTVLYVLVAYRNNRIRGTSTVGTTELAQYETSREIRAFLARSVLWACALDLPIVNALSEHLPHSRRSILYGPTREPAESVDIRCPVVVDLQNGRCREMLNSLGLNPRMFSVQRASVTTTISFGHLPLFGDIPEERYVVSFPFSGILQEKHAGAFRKILRGLGTVSEETFP